MNVVFGKVAKIDLRIAEKLEKAGANGELGFLYELIDSLYEDHEEVVCPYSPHIPQISTGGLKFKLQPVLDNGKIVPINCEELQRIRYVKKKLESENGLPLKKQRYFKKFYPSYWANEQTRTKKSQSGWWQQVRNGD